MFLRKILGRFLTTAPEKQELSSQQPLQVSTEPGQQLELIPATPSIQPYPQQMILPPCDELHFYPPNQPQQLNQSQVPYPQHFNTSLNSSSVSPSKPLLNQFLTCSHSNTIITSTTYSFISNTNFPRQYSNFNKFLFDIVFTITGTISTTTNSS